MVIEVTFDVTDVYISTTVSPVYVNVSFEAPAGGGAVWGDITGTLSDQTDLQSALDLKVPYSGATTNVNLGEYEIKAGQVTLDTSPTGTATVGTTRWNDTTGLSETTLKGGTVVLKNGVDLVARVVNKVSPNTTLTKAAYQAVRVSGAQGQRLAVAFAQANNDNNSADTIGLVIETIATNQEGFIMTVGQIEGINTTGSLQGETWNDGDIIYLSPTVAGAVTNVKPSGGQHLVIIGYVEYAHAVNGRLYIKISNGWEITELHDVDVTSPANNEALIYESATALWKNKSIATALGYTPANAATTLTINGVTFDLSANRTFTVGSVTGSGASGQVAYWTGTSTQSGSNNLFWDAANTALAIGGTTIDANIALQINSAKGVRISGTGGGFGYSIVRGTETTGIANSGSASFLSSTNTIIFQTAGTEAARFNSSQRLLIGTTSDSGQRLQVNGDTLLTASANIVPLTISGYSVTGSGATNGFTINGTWNTTGFPALIYGNLTNTASGFNSSLFRMDVGGLQTFNISTIGTIKFGTVTGANSGVGPANPSAIPTLNGTSLNLYMSGGSYTGYEFHFTNFTATRTATSGTNGSIRTAVTFNPTSGNGTYDIISIFNQINQTGGANGITRGLNVAPILTAAADWRSIEWSNNSGWGLYGAGSAPNYLSGNLLIGSTNNFAKLYVGGITATASAQSFIFSQPSITGALTDLYSFISSIVGNLAVNVTNAYHFRASQSGLSTSTITNQFGFHAENSITGATNNYGFYGNIPSAAGRWNLYMSGTAANYLNGELLLGSTSNSGEKLQVTGTMKVTGNVTSNGSFTSSITGASASLIAVNRGTNYPRAQFEIGNSSADFNIGLNIAASSSTSVLQKPAFLVVSTNKDSLNANSYQLNFGITTTDATISTTNRSNSTGAGAGVPLIFSPSFVEAMRLTATSGNLLIGTTTDVASSILTLASTTKGFLPPRMTTTQKNAISSPAAGLVVYDTTDNKHYGYDGTTWNAFY